MSLDFSINYKIHTGSKPDSFLSFCTQSNLDTKGYSSRFDRVLPLLQKLFSIQLPRSSGIYIDKMDENIKLVSKIYKRGVALKVQDTVYSPYEEYEGKTLSTNVMFRSSKEIESLVYGGDYFSILDRNVSGFNDSGFNGIRVDISEGKKDLKYLKEYLTFVDDILNKDSSILKKTWLLIGGGVLSDTFGFISYLYGTSFSIVPTSLCSMVDACLGGKTGINFSPYGKNQVGRFYFPGSIIICSKFIQTLTKTDIQSGYTEALKVALLEHDFSLMDEIIDIYNKGYTDSFKLDFLIQRTLLIKKKFVEQDPIENTTRRALNLGHSIAHLLEQIIQSSGGYLPHGIAVGVGILVSLEVSKTLLYLSEEKYNYIIDRLIRSNLIFSFSKLSSFVNQDNSKVLENIFDSTLIKELLLQDKKNTTKDLSQNTINFVCLTDDSYRIEHIEVDTLIKGWKRYQSLRF